ncbi:peptidoglycan DD-metalloendopeptidase family protein [Nocardioides mesophilus]|uniref:Peptidoglycan DD-metalloendopeptidase family protein n=1 Tax=Nocardioides mesophilus TaxID=433659 RepID=A0A7G9RHN8_9ACTN|nr:peptidoglycan DD-metalloendopeptidase family protein [Nocardioides mesophilus]
MAVAAPAASFEPRPARSATVATVSSGTGSGARRSAVEHTVRSPSPLSWLPTRAGGNATASSASATGTWPLSPAPAVVAGFDPPAQPWSSGHRGVDLAGAVGQPVRAALSGTVTFAGPLAGVGVVVVDHGDFRTTYQPVAATVRVGDVVETGSLLGRLQMLGSHCLPAACLHWGLLRGKVYENPLVLVGAGPVRLLAHLPGAGTAGLTPAVVF